MRNITKIPLGRFMKSVIELGESQLSHQKLFVPPVVQPNFAPPVIPNFSMDIMKKVNTEQTIKEHKIEQHRFIDQHTLDMLNEGRALSRNISQKVNEAKIEPVNGTHEKDKEVKKEEPPLKKIDSVKTLQEEVFKLAKKNIQNNGPALFLFTLSEYTLKKISMPLFDGLYTAFANKNGEIPEDKAKAVLSIAKWLVLAIIAYALYNEYQKKIAEAQMLDSKLCVLFSKAQALGKDANGIAQRIALEAIELAGLQKNMDLNNKILELLDECAKSDNDPSGVLHGFKIFLQDQIASVASNKPIKQAEYDNKIVRELYRRQGNDPLATQALDKIGPSGVEGTVNTLKTDNEKLQDNIDHKKQVIECKQALKEEKQKNLASVIETAKNTAEQLESKVVTRFSFYQPQYRECQKKHQHLRLDDESNSDVPDVTLPSPGKS